MDPEGDVNHPREDSPNDSVLINLLLILKVVPTTVQREDYVHSLKDRTKKNDGEVIYKKLSYHWSVPFQKTVCPLVCNRSIKNPTLIMTLNFIINIFVRPTLRNY